MTLPDHLHEKHVPDATAVICTGGCSSVEEWVFRYLESGRHEGDWEQAIAIVRREWLDVSNIRFTV